eukprot:9269776-Pyramimonas_sp.AAC.1
MKLEVDAIPDSPSSGPLPSSSALPSSVKRRRLMIKTADLGQRGALSEKALEAIAKGSSSTGPLAPAKWTGL